MHAYIRVWYAVWMWMCMCMCIIVQVHVWVSAHACMCAYMNACIGDECVLCVYVYVRWLDAMLMHMGILLSFLNGLHAFSNTFFSPCALQHVSTRFNSFQDVILVVDASCRIPITSNLHDLLFF